MKKSILILGLLSVVMVSCGESDEQRQQRLQDNYERSCDSIEAVHKIANSIEADSMLKEALKK